MKLWLVEFVGMSPCYVVAENTTAAYDFAREDLNQRRQSSYVNRELKRISLVAENADHPDCGTRLYITE